MRIALLTSDGIEHGYVARRFAEAFGESLVAVVIAAPPTASAIRRFKKYWRRYSLPQLASRVASRSFSRLTGMNTRRSATYARYLGPAADQDRLPRKLVRSVSSHNGAETLELLESLSPDVIAVYGTGMIKGPVMRMARKRTLNMHTGISPRYRGADTVFWPLHNGEPEWVGVTIHELTAGVDAGPILDTGRPTIEANDDENSLFCKCVVLGTELYIETIWAVCEGRAQVRPQHAGEGREYRFVDRTLWAELRVRKLLAGGLLRRYARRNP